MSVDFPRGVILVEGVNDAELYGRVLVTADVPHGVGWDRKKHRQRRDYNAGGINLTVQFADDDSQSNDDAVLGSIGNQLRKPGAFLGIVLDADQDRPVAARVAQFVDRVQSVELSGQPFVLEPVPRPGSLSQGGYVGFAACRNRRTPIGLFVAPNNADTGGLEQMLLDAASLPSLRDFAAAASLEARSHGALYRDSDHRKAIVKTYLAWQDEPESRYGVGFDQGAFANGKAFSGFVGWVKSLCDLAGVKTRRI